MKTYHNITDDKRVTVDQTKSRRVARFQQKEEDAWVTKCIRPYQIDIRVDPVSDIIRVAKQQGY